MTKTRRFFLIGVLLTVEILYAIALFMPMHLSLEFYEKDPEGSILQAGWEDEGETEHLNVKGKVSVPYDEIEENPSLHITADTDKLCMDIKDYFGTLYTIEDDQLLQYAGETIVYPENTFLEGYTLEETLNYYKNSGYLIILSVAGDGLGGLTYDAAYTMNIMGANKTPSNFAVGSSFLTVIYDGTVIYNEGAETEQLSFSNDIEGNKIIATSAGYISGGESEIQINDIEYSSNGRGINIVIYDCGEKKLIDSLVYDTADDSAMTRNYDAFYAEHTYQFSDRFITRMDSYIQVIIFLRKVILILFMILTFLVWKSIYDIEKEKNQENYLKTSVMVQKQIIMIVFLSVALCLTYGYRYLEKEFEDTSFSQLLYHMTTNLGGTNWTDFAGLFLNLFFRIVAAVIVGIVVLQIAIRKKKKPQERMRFIWWSRAIIGLVSLTLIVTTIKQFDFQYQMVDYVVSQNVNSQIYEDYYVNPKNAQITFPEKKKNLIYIFMESMEITNADKVNGGAKSFNSIPELTEIALENDNFNGRSNRLTGAEVLGNTGWTVAGMVAQTSGIPLNVPIDGNSYGEDEFLPGDYSLGEILEENGYHNCLLIGSEAEFGGRKTYFKTHGNYEICDYNWAIDEGYIDKDYKVWWGYEDKKLFEYAKDKVTELAKSDQPFNLTLLTADTHFTDGYVCEDCDTQYNAQYANVLACSSRKTAEFLQWLQEQDFYEDTVVVLSGDHLCMDSSYFSDISDDYVRKTYVSVVNSSKEEPVRYREYCTMDLFPTTLSAMGCDIQGDRLGLGTDLYSATNTLLEQFGEDEFTYQLSLNSKYYNQFIFRKNEK